MIASKVAVSTTAVSVAAGTNYTSAYPQTVVIYNEGPDNCFIGGSGVTAAQGFKLAASSLPIWWDLVGGDQIYAICDTAQSATLSIMKRGS